MKIIEVAIDSLRLDPANARRHSEQNLRAIAASLRRFGQRKNIVVDEEGFILAGNGTWLAARSLGWPTLHVHQVTGLSAAQKRALALADNRSAELADWDAEELQASVEACLAEEFSPEDLEELGFGAEDLELILERPGSVLKPIEEVDVGESVTDSTARFSFGPYASMVARRIYERFDAFAKRKRAEGVVLLSDVLDAWGREDDGQRGEGADRAGTDAQVADATAARDDPDVGPAPGPG